LPEQRGAAVRMRRSLAELEREFALEVVRQRQRQALLAHSAAKRRLVREIDRRRRRGSLRYFLLVLAMVTTAVAVTVVMFVTLYLLLG